MNDIKRPQIRNAPSDALWFVPLGGTGEIGMNLNVYGCQGKWMAVDMGVTFGDDQIPGVDVVMADHLFLEEQADDLAGIVITHAHEDHIGAVAYLWPDLRCPVYATPFAAEFLRHKLKEEGLDGEVPLHEVPLGGRVTVGPFDVEFVSMTHSIPEPNGLMIRTPHGNVFHTGDWKFDPEPLISDTADTKRLKELGDEGVLACISDSTNILTRRRQSGSEGEVRRSMEELFSRFGGKIAVACFASNVARLESIIHAGRANGREICFVGRSLWRILETARKTGYMQDVGRILEAQAAADLPDSKVLYVCTGSQGEGRAALMRVAHGNHPFLKLEAGDVAIFSSRVIPGNEKAIFRLQNALTKLGVEIITDRDEFIHVSGHPTQDEVQELYEFLRPTSVIPVHGEQRHLHHHADFALNAGALYSRVVENGDVVNLTPQGPEVIGEVPVGRLVLEGDRIVPMDSPILRDRKRMVVNGAAVVTLVMNGRGDLIQDPLVTTHGLFNPGEEEGEEELTTVTDAVRDAIARLDRRQRRDDDEVRETARRAVRRTFNQDQGRKPLTDVHLVRV